MGTPLYVPLFQSDIVRRLGNENPYVPPPTWTPRTVNRTPSTLPVSRDPLLDLSRRQGIGPLVGLVGLDFLELTPLLDHDRHQDPSRPVLAHLKVSSSQPVRATESGE